MDKITEQLTEIQKKMKKNWIEIMRKCWKVDENRSNYEKNRLKSMKICLNYEMNCSKSSIIDQRFGINVENWN